MKLLLVWSGLLSMLLLLSLTTGASFFYRIVYVLLVVPFLGLGLVVLATRRLEGRVERVSPYLQVGQSVQERFTIWNHHWWPKLLLEVEHRTNRLRPSGRVVTLWPYRSISWVSETLCDQRGLYVYGKLVATSRDPLGVLAKRIEIGEAQTALIYPATVNLLGFAGTGSMGPNPGISQSYAHTPTPVASGVRNYARGDTISRIHWPTSLRLEKLMVKEFEKDNEGPTAKTASEELWIVLDLWEAVQSGSGPESTVEYAVSTAASVAKAFLEEGRAVGLVAAGDEQWVIPVAKGFDQLTRIMDALALIREGKSGPLLDTIAATVRQLNGYATVMVISAAPLEELSEANRVLGRHGGRLLALYLDAASFDDHPAFGRRASLDGRGPDVLVIHKGDDLSTTLDFRSFSVNFGLGKLNS